MSKSLGVSLVWYRNDLRIKDHQGLSRAIESNRQGVAYYNFNPELFKMAKSWNFTKKQHIELKNFCEELKIDFFYCYFQMI